VRVWLASFPRSGNTFARVVLRSVYGVGSSSAYPEGKGRLATELAETVADAGLEPRKTHELEHAGDDSPAIYVLRDGRDCYVSYAHFALELDERYRGMAYSDVLRTLIDSPDQFGGWSRHVDVWTSRAAPTAVIRYEDLLADPAATVAGACEELGLDLPAGAGAPPAMASLREREPLLFRRGVAGSWRDEMPPELEELFWSRHGQTMARVGYCR
jgi:sulfotransferase family protein